MRRDVLNSFFMSNVSRRCLGVLHNGFSSSFQRVTNTAVKAQMKVAPAALDDPAFCRISVRCQLSVSSVH